MNNENEHETRQQGNWHADLYGVSTIARQLIEDVDRLYGRTIRLKAGKSNGASAAALKAEFESPSNGELVVVATRNQKLSEQLRLLIAHLVGLRLDQSVVMFSANDTLLRFTRRMIDEMSGIASESGLYDSKLDADELSNLSYALVRLSRAQIFMNQGRKIQLDNLCEAVRRHHQETGEIGLMLVDSVGQLVDSKCRLLDVQKSLVGLRRLAEELMVPVLALYHLDPTVENHPSSLTRDELHEVEKLAVHTEGFLLMNGHRGNLVIEPAKISNAKVVEWLSNIPRRGLID